MRTGILFDSKSLIHCCLTLLLLCCCVLSARQHSRWNHRHQVQWAQTVVAVPWRRRRPLRRYARTLVFPVFPFSSSYYWVKPGWSGCEIIFKTNKTPRAASGSAVHKATVLRDGRAAHCSLPLSGFLPHRGDGGGLAGQSRERSAAVGRTVACHHPHHPSHLRHRPPHHHRPRRHVHTLVLRRGEPTQNNSTRLPFTLT